jgi:hypothetical protein
MISRQPTRPLPLRKVWIVSNCTWANAVLSSTGVGSGWSCRKSSSFRFVLPTSFWDDATRFEMLSEPFDFDQVQISWSKRGILPLQKIKDKFQKNRVKWSGFNYWLFQTLFGVLFLSCYFLQLGKPKSFKLLGDSFSIFCLRFSGRVLYRSSNFLAISHLFLFIP